MMLLTDEQLNNLNREALVIIVASLQDQLSSMRVQLDHANSQLADTTRQIELLTEQIRIMNQRHFGRQSEWIFCFVRFFLNYPFLFLELYSNYSIIKVSIAITET